MSYLHQVERLDASARSKSEQQQSHKGGLLTQETYAANTGICETCVQAYV
jgi:hypothetical protein